MKKAKKHKNILLLLVIIGGFIAIRLPHINKEIDSSPHPPYAIKYATYVPVALNMYKEGGPFLNKNSGYTNFFARTTFSDSFARTPPFYEWSLFLLFFLLQGVLSLSVIIKSFTAVLGGVLLYFMYTTFNKLLDLEIALLAVVLIATTAMMGILTHLTVYDLPALILFFISLNYFLSDREDLSLLFAGFSVLMKLSFILITPVCLALLILSRRSDKLYKLAKLGLFSVIPYLSYTLFLRPLPEENLAIISFGLALFAGVNILLLKLFQQKGVLIKNYFYKLYHRKKIFYALVLIAGIFIGLVGFKKFNEFSFFLVDLRLLFSLNFYKSLFSQLSELSHPLYLWTFPFSAGLITYLFVKDKYKKRIEVIGSLFLTGIIYTTIAAKSVFIHGYYKHIPIISLVLIFSFSLWFMKRKIKNKKIRMSAYVLILLVLGIPQIQSTKAYLTQRDYDGTKKMKQYLQQHVSENQKILHTASIAKIFSIDNNKKFTPLPYNSSKLRSKLKNKSLRKVLTNNKAVYFLSLGKYNFIDFTRLYLEFPPKSKLRSENILQQVSRNQNYLPDKKKREIEQTYKKHKLGEIFELEKKIGDWYLYKVK